MKKKWACTDCDYSTDFKRDQRHLVTHSKVKAYKCDACGKGFTRNGDLTRHTKSVHTKESQHECEVCKKVFIQRPHLL